MFMCGVLPRLCVEYCHVYVMGKYRDFCWHLTRFKGSVDKKYHAAALLLIESFSKEYEYDYEYEI
jgi:hypothetical protein